MTASPGGESASCGTSPCTVSGLTNGTACTFRVVATNRVGSSVASVPSSAVTPMAPVTPPTPPTTEPTPEPTAPPTTSPAPLPAPADDWYRDPIDSTHRGDLAAVPDHPSRTSGQARRTTAIFRSHDDRLVVPARVARGHQLAAGQGVQVRGLFRLGSAQLSEHGRAHLRRVARSMTDARAVTCEGYADYSPRHHERTLSAKRARRVCAVLARTLGTLETRAVGYGAKVPAVIGGTASERGANRRVVLVVRR